MTTPSDKEKISRILLNNSKMNKVVLESKDFNPTNIGNGVFVKTVEGDVLYDLRVSSERPFCGHSHPLTVQHNFKALENELELNYYSVPKTEYTKMIETFQKVHFTEILKDDFKITYHNIVIDYDESVLDYEIEFIKSKTQHLIENNRSVFFWLVEKDIPLLSNNSYLFFSEFINSIEAQKHIHIVTQHHFISSVFIKSHHLFSEDENIQLFLSFKKYYEDIIALDKAGKNAIDFEIIDNFLKDNFSTEVYRKGRYLIFEKPLDINNLYDNAILASNEQESPIKVISIPISCTNDELSDILTRLKKST